MYSSDLDFLKRKAAELNMNVSELVLKLTNELKKENKKNNGGK